LTRRIRLLAVSPDEPLLRRIAPTASMTEPKGQTQPQKNLPSNRESKSMTKEKVIPGRSDRSLSDVNNITKGLALKNVSGGSRPVKG
jgi:hypothetical protein